MEEGFNRVMVDRGGACDGCVVRPPVESSGGVMFFGECRGGESGKLQEEEEEDYLMKKK